MKTPTISVPLLAYNHEKYVAEAIQSVLEQSFSDFELIVINDGSTDRTDEIIQSFQDERIIYHSQPNQGPVVAANNAIKMARGKYVAIICGDDAWFPNRLQRHHEALQASKYRWGFSWVEVIDDDSRLVEGPHVFKEFYDRTPMDRAQIVRATFFEGCPLHTNTAMVERELYGQSGFFDLTSIQAHDFAMWNRLLLQHTPLMLPERLVKYRVRSNLQNLSSSSHSGRTWFELYQHYRVIFDEMPSELFREAFSANLRNADFREGPEYELEKAFLYLQHKSPLIRSLGNEKLSKLLRDSRVRQVAETRYAFGLRELYALNDEVDICNSRDYQKLETGYHELLSSFRRQGQEIADLQASLAARDEAIREQQEKLDILWIAREQWQARIAAQDQELLIYRTSKLQRLRSTILYDKFSIRKLMKIVYLTVAIATPKPMRRRFKPAVEEWKRRFDNFAHRKPEIRKIRNEEWPANKPLISIVIPCFNYGPYVEEAVDSVLSQTFQDFEIIVVDGGSTDPATLDVVRSLQKPKTTVYLREGRHLVGDNRDFGISRARGKYICCLDADDKLKPTYLEKALFLLETYAYDLVSTSLQCFGASELYYEVHPSPSLDQITKYNQFSTVAVFSKSLWHKARGYHDWGVGKEHVSEDWDLWVRMMALGARATNIPEALMLYRRHDCETLSTDAKAPSLGSQIIQICHFNRKHLSRRNHRLSERRNTTMVEVDDPFKNIVNRDRRESTKPSLLFALPFVITGGADTVLLGVAEYLAASGFNLSLITSIPTDANLGDNTPRYEAITKQIYHLPKFLRDQTRWKDFLFYLIASKRVDVLFLAGSVFVYDLLPEIKRRFPDIRVVDQLFNEFGHIENNRKYSRHIDLHVVANETIKKTLIERFDEDPNRIRVVVHGVDVRHRFNPEDSEVESLPKPIQLQDKFVVSFIGRFSEEKCPDTFVEIARSLKNEENLHFVMVGNGPEYQRIKKNIAALHLEDKIYAPGFVPEMRPYVKMSGVVVIPSTIEGIPIVLMESLALGVPVVASNVGGIPSIIRDGFNGFVCEPSNIEGFVRNIRQIATDEGLRNTLRANARQSAVQHLDVDDTNRAYHDLLLALIHGDNRQSGVFLDAKGNGSSESDHQSGARAMGVSI